MSGDFEEGGDGSTFLHGADKTCHSGLKSTLAQNMSMGSNQYPRTTEEALNILNTYSQTTKHQHKKKIYKSDERWTKVAFMQITKELFPAKWFRIQPALMWGKGSLCMGMKQKGEGAVAHDCDDGK